jgi:hypothetical protein
MLAVFLKNSQLLVIVIRESQELRLKYDENIFMLLLLLFERCWSQFTNIR